MCTKNFCKLPGRLSVENLLTLPSGLAVTLISQVVWCVGADGMIGTWVRGARSEDLSTCGSTVRKLAQAGETCHTIHTSALVQTGAGSTFVDVHLAEITCWRHRRDNKTYCMK